MTLSSGKKLQQWTMRVLQMLGTGQRLQTTWPGWSLVQIGWSLPFFPTLRRTIQWWWNHQPTLISCLGARWPVWVSTNPGWHIMWDDSSWKVRKPKSQRDLRNMGNLDGFVGSKWTKPIFFPQHQAFSATTNQRTTWISPLWMRTGTTLSAEYLSHKHQPRHRKKWLKRRELPGKFWSAFV